VGVRKCVANDGLVVGWGGRGGGGCLGNCTAAYHVLYSVLITVRVPRVMYSALAEVLESIESISSR
jgi:hypothetical protein